MKLPSDIVEQFRVEGAKGGKAKAAKMTRAERVAHSAKMHNSMTEDDRKKRAKNASAHMSKKDKHERAMKAVAARLKNLEARKKLRDAG